MDAIVTSLRLELRLPDEVDIAEEEDWEDDSVEVDVSPEEEDVHVGGVDDVSKQAKVDDRLGSVLELLCELGGAMGSGGCGGRLGTGGGSVSKRAAMLESSSRRTSMPSSGWEKLRALFRSAFKMSEVL